MRGWTWLAARPDFFDEKRYSEGDVELESTHGDIRIGRGLDRRSIAPIITMLACSKAHRAEGLVAPTDDPERRGCATATTPPILPCGNGQIDIRAGTLADFAALNKRLTENGITEKRSFVIKTGDLVIGDEVKARHASASRRMAAT